MKAVVSFAIGPAKIIGFDEIIIKQMLKKNKVKNNLTTCKTVGLLFLTMVHNSADAYILCTVVSQKRIMYRIHCIISVLWRRGQMAVRHVAWEVCDGLPLRTAMLSEDFSDRDEWDKIKFGSSPVFSANGGSILVRFFFVSWEANRLSTSF